MGNKLRLTIAVAAALVALVHGCSGTDQAGFEAVLSFAQKHDAVTDWDEFVAHVTGMSRARPPWSIEIEQVSPFAGDTAILFVAHLEDIRRSAGRTLAEFEAVNSSDYYWLDLSLELDGAMIELLSRGECDGDQEFALVARVHSFTRPEYGVTGWRDDEALEDGEESTPVHAWLQVTASPVFKLHGVLLDALATDDATSVVNRMVSREEKG